MCKWKTPKKDPISNSLINSLINKISRTVFYCVSAFSRRLRDTARTHAGPGPGPGPGPGATFVDTGGSGLAAVSRVTVPEGVQPGQEFQVYAGNRMVRVRCPLGTAPGQSLQVTFPIESQSVSSSLSQEQSPSTSSQQNIMMNIMNSPNVEGIAGDEGAYVVTIPEGVQGGQQFPLTIQGQQLVVTVPTYAPVGMRLRVVPPPPPPPPKDQPMQLFEVQVPKEGVLPGQPFALLAGGGVRVWVTCPVDAAPGQRIRFELPLALWMTTRKPKSPPNDIKLSYDVDGWTRTIRVSDRKFQWVRMDDKGDIDHTNTTTRFHAEKSAYVRTLEFRPGNDNDSRIRDGVMALVPAKQAFTDSCVGEDDLITYADIAQAQVKAFEDKAQWFQESCKNRLAVEWNEGHMRIHVRREFLLQDSVDAVMSLSRRDLRKIWRLEFIGEAGIDDAGGLAREWFQLVTEEIFDPRMGLWQSSEANQMCMQINPASKFNCEDYQVYYRFLGRVMGKALFDGQLVVGHMVQYIYKHMLGWPITFKDMELLDQEYYSNLKNLQQLADSGEDLTTLCLDFTTTIKNDMGGAKEEIELVEGGKDMVVDNDNYPEYMEACWKYRMMEAVRAQLTELLLGLYDVVPEPFLAVFDFQELELLMCGIPTIDLDDWKEHTEYSGDYQGLGESYPTCQWFWEVVEEEFDQEMKARLLQFVTGTSGVPSRGFGVLQGNDGNIRKFTLHGVNVDTCLYPRAQTCFNRLDLPAYDNKEDLRDRLKVAVTMVATGFDIF